MAGPQTLLSAQSYDSLGRVTQRRYGTGQFVQYTYDTLDRLTELRYNTGTGTAAYRYIYDAEGRLARALDNLENRRTDYTYDLAGRLVEQKQRAGQEDGSAARLYLRYDYEDGTNRLLRDIAQLDGGASVTTGYTYEAHSDRLVGVTQNGASRLRYSYDGLGRLSGRTLYLPGGGTVNTAYGYVSGAGAQATTALLGWYDNGFTRNTYGYDSRGNLIYDGQTATGVAASSTPGLQYVYDDLNQLVRINDVAGGKTYTYTYDNRGNLRQKNEYALSTGELGTPTRTVDYGYGNADWQDQLTSYNGSAITYDAIGNPTIWYNGTQMTWQKGRQLTGINSSVSGTTVYTYDDSGLRTSKTMNGVRTEYYRSGSRLIGQKQGSNVMQLLYDANGLYGFLYNGTPHYYVYNGQGDVVRLISASGATEAMYTYDAWGKPLSVTDASGNTISDASHIANVNPIRYRGYYYDVETGFYYLQSRYYDPEVGRFINADGLVSTGQGILGYNMYAYCGNNPISRIDFTGMSWAEVEESFSNLWNGVKNWFKSSFGAESTTTVTISETETAILPDPSPVTVKQGIILSRTIEKYGDASKLFSVYANKDVDHPIISSTVGAKVNVSDFTLDLSLGLDNIGFSGSLTRDNATSSIGVRLNLAEFKAGIEVSQDVQFGNTTQTIYTNYSVSGWTILAAAAAILTGQPCYAY